MATPPTPPFFPWYLAAPLFSDHDHPDTPHPPPPATHHPAGMTGWSHALTGTSAPRDRHVTSPVPEQEPRFPGRNLTGDQGDTPAELQRVPAHRASPPIFPLPGPPHSTGSGCLPWSQCCSRPARGRHSVKIVCPRVKTGGIAPPPAGAAARFRHPFDHPPKGRTACDPPPARRRFVRSTRRPVRARAAGVGTGGVAGQGRQSPATRGVRPVEPRPPVASFPPRSTRARGRGCDWSRCWWAPRRSLLGTAERPPVPGGWRDGEPRGGIRGWSGPAGRLGSAVSAEHGPAGGR